MCERFPEAELTALFVVDTSVTYQPEQYVGVKFGEIQGQREAEGEAILSEAEELAARFDRSLTTAIDHGRPANEILEYVEESDVDHVVPGSYSRDVLDRLAVPVTVIR